MQRTLDNAAKRKNTMDMQYQLKAGSYYLYDMRDTPSVVTGERRFRLKTDTVAIAFVSLRPLRGGHWPGPRRFHTSTGS